MSGSLRVSMIVVESLRVWVVREEERLTWRVVREEDKDKDLKKE